MQKLRWPKVYGQGVRAFLTWLVGYIMHWGCTVHLSIVTLKLHVNCMKMTEHDIETIIDCKVEEGLYSKFFPMLNARKLLRHDLNWWYKQYNILESNCYATSLICYGLQIGSDWLVILNWRATWRLSRRKLRWLMTRDKPIHFDQTNKLTVLADWASYNVCSS